MKDSVNKKCLLPTTYQALLETFLFMLNENSDTVVYCYHQKPSDFTNEEAEAEYSALFA